jgi:hypothetical protein
MKLDVMWNIVGFLASGLVVAAFFMRQMIPLRILALCSNVVFLAYGLRFGLLPVWTLHAVLLPMNGCRLAQAMMSRSPRVRQDSGPQPIAGT